MQEFALQGGGTPLPFDPPKVLVSSGIYAYFANPMQTSTSLMLMLWGAMLGNFWIAISGIMGIVYSIGFAAWSEEADLITRFGKSWQDYRQNVKAWLPRWRPWFPKNSDYDRIYIAKECGPCSELALWLSTRQPLNLELVPAEAHPTTDLKRLTYESAQTEHTEVGVAALARAMMHIHFGWALLGILICLPIIRPSIHLLVDAVGGEPKLISRAQRQTIIDNQNQT
ncbi:MAG: isoprenylcysteine carboxylmethyltransferase family protein [Chloroflexota bacterium]